VFTRVYQNIREKGTFQTVNRRAQHELQRNVKEEEANISDNAQRGPLATAR